MTRREGILRLLFFYLAAVRLLLKLALVRSNHGVDLFKRVAKLLIALFVLLHEVELDVQSQAVLNGLTSQF